MTKRIRTLLLTTLLLSCIGSVLAGCGHKEEAPGKDDSPELKQQRQDKAGN